METITKKHNRKMIAVAMVAMMAMVAVVPLMDADSEGAVGDGGIYTYTITYNASQMATTSAAISVAGMEPVYHPSLSGSTPSGYGSWTWDRETGLGPFNSYYAAFDQNNGNRFVAVLDPYDLTKGMDGTDYTSRMSSLNIMWVLPTVYWKSTATSLTLSNDPASGGTAYAHNIDGHVYKNLAIGVYEGSMETISGRSVLSSQSGVAPHHNVPLTTFRNLAHNVTMDSSLKGDSTYNSYSMLWNFYQWELFKLCSFAVMENFNSQAVVGNGPIYGNNLFTTGSTDARGPYTGNTGDMTDDTNDVDNVKLFIENAWGGVREFVDGAMLTGSGFYLDSSSTPTGSTTPGGNVIYVNQAPGLSGNSTVILTDSRVWGFAGRDGVSTDYNVGLADTIWNGENTSGRVAAVGGDSSIDAGNFNKCGISYVTINLDPSQSYARVGSRLAFVFDQDLSVSDITVEPNDSTYGSVSKTDATVYYDAPVTVTGKTLKIGNTTITATETPDDDQYDYGWDGWYNGSTKITTGGRITSDTDITAKFTREVKEYTVSIASNNPDYGTVSTATIEDVPYGTSIDAVGARLTVGAQAITATPSESTDQYEYSFSQWTIGGAALPTGATVQGDTTVTAVFEQGIRVYDVPIRLNNPDYGTISTATIEDVPYGTVITIAGTTVTLGSYGSSTATIADPTEQYIFSWGGWTYLGSPVASGTTQIIGAQPITANVATTLQTYTITWIIGETVETQDYEYGATPTHETPDAPTEGDVFKGWDPPIVQVTGPATYTATFGPDDTDALHKILDIVPYLAILGILFYAASAVASGNMTGRDAVMVTVGTSVGILIMVRIVMPAIAGM